MPEENVLDAVNAALGDAIDAPAETEEVATPEVETPAEESDTETSEGDSSAEESDSEAEETDEEAEARGAERNPDGTFKKKEPAAEEKPAEKPKKDPINDPIPENLKKDTSERIRSLIDTAKTVTAERDTIKKDFDYLINGVQATGATPAQ